MFYSYSGKEKESKNDSKDQNEKFGIHKSVLTKEKLPKKITLKNNMVEMTLRRAPFILRYHKFRDTSSHEYHYAEMLMFLPWVDEERDLYPEDAAKCIAKYEHNKSQIELTKKTLFPYNSEVEIIEKTQENDLSIKDLVPQHIFDNLDPEFELEKEESKDCDKEQYEEMLTEHEHDGNDKTFSDIDKNVATGKYPQTIIFTDDELLQSARSLVPEQRVILDDILNYCRSDNIHEQNNTIKKPKTIRKIVLGSAGSGKSFLIKNIVNWVNKWMNKRGSNIEYPKILVIAPTGLAAMLIDGCTIHAAFNFDFSSEATPLATDKLDELRHLFKHLKFIVLDEISMVSGDLLYRIHIRLQEIMQSTDLFGALNVLLFGDLLQLPPFLISIVSIFIGTAFSPYLNVKSGCFFLNVSPDLGLSNLIIT